MIESDGIRSAVDQNVLIAETTMASTVDQLRIWLKPAGAEELTRPSADFGRDLVAGDARTARMWVREFRLTAEVHENSLAFFYGRVVDHVPLPVTPGLFTIDHVPVPDALPFGFSFIVPVNCTFTPSELIEPFD